MNYEFYILDKRIDLVKNKYPCIELAFIEVFKGLLMDDKRIADDFQVYALQYHKDYKYLNYADGCFLTMWLEASSRELHISQVINNVDINLDYDYNDSIFFGRMIGDFLIRNKNISVIRHEKKEVITAYDDYPKYFNKELSGDNKYRLLRVAPIDFIIRDNKPQKFMRKTFSYQQQNYTYNPNDMCSYLGGYPDKTKTFLKKKYHFT